MSNFQFSILCSRVFLDMPAAVVVLSSEKRFIMTPENKSPITRIAIQILLNDTYFRYIKELNSIETDNEIQVPRFRASKFEATT